MTAEVICNGQQAEHVARDVTEEGDVEKLVREVIDEWRKANPGKSLFGSGCYVRVDKA